MFGPHRHRTFPNGHPVFPNILLLCRFREQAFQWHPDLYSGDDSKKHAEEKFKDAQVAYEGLLSRCQT